MIQISMLVAAQYFSAIHIYIVSNVVSLVCFKDGKCAVMDDI